MLLYHIRLSCNELIFYVLLATKLVRLAQ